MPSPNRKTHKNLTTDTFDDSKTMSSVRIIKKYPNRRLYDMRSSAYITLTDVKNMVLTQESFSVIDAKTGADLTRTILLQIILEEESLGMPILTETMLSQVIRLYGHVNQNLLGTFLEQQMQAFTEMQEKMAPMMALYPSTHAWQQMMGQYLTLTAQSAQNWQERLKQQTEKMFGETASAMSDDKK